MNDPASSPPRLWVHIGLPKTGTTAIQAALAGARPRLRAAGLDYPKTGALDGGHVRLAWPLLSPERAARPDVLERLSPAEARDLWERLADDVLKRGCRQVVLSTEYFSEADPFALAELTRLVSTDVRILIYLRRQDELIESGYNQEVKAGLTSERFEVRPYAAHYDYSRRLAVWADAFGKDNILARVYQPSAMRRGAVADLAELLGIDLGLLGNPTELHNQSLPAGMVELQRIANSVGVSGGDLLAVLGDKVSSLTDGQATTFLSGDERRQILSLYEESNAAVARDYFGRDDGQLFDPPPSDGVAARREVSTETLTALLALVWRSLSEQVQDLRCEIDELRSKAVEEPGPRRRRRPREGR